MDQTIRFVTADDGVKLAYASSGKGTPLVKTANWLNHLEHDFRSPAWRHWFTLLSRHHTLYRYDVRGTGLSDRVDNSFSFERYVRDLEVVVDAAGLERFALLGISQGAGVAVEYAVRHPERVSHIVLHGGYTRGWGKRTPGSLRAGIAMMELVRLGWGASTSAFRRMFAELLMPKATEEQVEWCTELQRVTTTPEIAARLLESLRDTDVTQQLGKVRAPTLVLHSRKDALVPFDEGRRLAAGISGAQFVELDSINHLIVENEPAWERFVTTVGEFLGWPKDAHARPVVQPTPAEEVDGLTSREREILDLVAQGHTNQMIASQLFISEKTVRNHLTAVFGKIGVNSRAQAIVFARDRGLASRPH